MNGNPFNAHGQFHVPRWDGDPASFRDYQKEIKLFRMAADLKSDVCLVARLVQNLHGAAKEVAMNMDEKEWQPLEKR